MNSVYDVHMKFNLLAFLIITIFFSVGRTNAQNAAVDPARDVKFQISTAGGKTIYRIGEPVKLILSYTTAQSGYAVEQYPSPQFDDVIITPTEGVYDWLYRVNRLYSYDDVSYNAKLSETPVNIEITVNNLVRFDKPGKYKIKVVSRRVWRPTKGDSFRSHPVPLLSNEIGLEMKEMFEAEEQAEVKRIANLMDSAGNLNQHQLYKRELDYLTGDVSTAEKVRRFLKPPVYGGVTWLDSGTGLNIARNKELAIKLLEEAFRDPNREVNEYLVGELVHLRLLLEDEQQPSQAKDYWNLSKERATRTAELSKTYYAELLESLRTRAGKSQIAAAKTIFVKLPKDDASSNAYNLTKTFLLEKFDELTPYQQVELLDRFWDKIKTPTLIPSLEKILAGKEPTPAWRVRETAFKRLIELDPLRARPFIINEIRDSSSVMNPETFEKFGEKSLPETDDALLDQITKLASTTNNIRSPQWLNLKFKLNLAARFAGGKIYPQMLDIYKKYGVNWSYDLNALLLSYLAKYNDKEAIPLIEEKLSKAKNMGGSSVLSDLTKTNFTRGIEKLLQKRLQSDEQETATWAAYFLSKYGSKENKTLIEKRYNRWLAVWKNRRAELENPNAPPEVKSQPMFQINMLNALIRTDKWDLSETEVYRLKLTCLTANCLNNFRTNRQR
jgi:hypothetical protein